MPIGKGTQPRTPDAFVRNRELARSVLRIYLGELALSEMRCCILVSSPSSCFENQTLRPSRATTQHSAIGMGSRWSSVIYVATGRKRRTLALTSTAKVERCYSIPVEAVEAVEVQRKVERAGVAGTGIVVM